MARDRSPFREARVCECGDVGFVGLTRGMVALVDAEDVPAVAGRKWFTNHYAYAVVDERYVAMHSHLCGELVDHRNRDRFDNRRENLRPCTHQQNGWNRGLWGGVPFKGVNEHRPGAYRARIVIDGSSRSLGLYSDPVEAAIAYDKAAAEAFGEFALTNEMLGLLPSGAMR